MRPAFADRRGRDEDDEDDDEDEKEEMRALQKAVDLGLVLPLAEVLARVKDRLPGRVVSVEIERKRDRFVYEFKVVDAGGRRREVYVDAASADILEID